MSRFDKLYKIRNTTRYPTPNFMQKNSLVKLDMTTKEIFDDVKFSTEYWYHQNNRGVVNCTCGGTSSLQKHFMLVNPTNERTLRMNGNNCNRHRVYNKYGLSVKVQKYNKDNLCQSFYINSHNEIASTVYADMVIMT